ncbi:MAG TPA: hypothetical protein VG389_07835 [Myxococcota bacterium]|nr:hypothetical protein [Myxococcota bacterium]
MDGRSPMTASVKPRACRRRVAPLLGLGLGLTVVLAVGLDAPPSARAAAPAPTLEPTAAAPAAALSTADPGAAVQRKLPPGELVVRAAAGDLDGDGSAEIAAVIRTPGGAWRAAIHAADGAERWRAPLGPIDEGEVRADRAKVSVEALGGKAGGAVADFAAPLDGSAARALRLVVGADAHRALVPIFSGVTGAERGEYGRTVEIVDVNEDGTREVVVAELGDAHHLCDGGPARVHPRIWDRASGKLGTVKITPKATGLPVLAAVAAAPGDPPGAPDTLSFFAASSSPGFGGSPAAIPPPRAAGDGDPATAWVEGDPREGAGAFVVAHVEGERPLRALRLVPGDAHDAKSWKTKNRLREAVLVLGDEHAGTRFLVTFPPLAKPGAVVVRLPAPVPATCVALVVRTVYDGTDKNKTAVGEVTALTDLDFATGPERLALLDADLTAGGTRAAAAAAALLRLAAAGPPLDAGARDLVAAALAAGAGPAGRAVLDAAHAAGGPIDALVPAFLAALGSPDAAFHDAAVRALAAAGERVARTLAPAVAAETRPAVAAGAVEVLGVVAAAAGGRPDSAAVVALLALLDGGPDALLPALGRALAAPWAYAALVSFAAARDESFARAPALAALLAGVPGPPAGLPATEIDRAVALLARWTAPAHPFAVRFNACRALAHFPGRGAVAADALALAALKDPEEVVRERALLSLVLHPGARTAAVTARALADPDRRVREAALREAPAATAAAPDARATALAATIALLDGDPWPELRRAAARALGAFGGDDAARALLAAFHDVDVEVAAAAMESAAALAAPGTAAAAESILADEALGARRRIAAAETLARLGAGAGAAAPTLLRTLERYRMLAPGDPRAEELAMACAHALGEMGAAAPAAARDAKVREALTDALVGGRTDAVRTACAWALGRLDDKAACEILADAAENAPAAPTRDAARKARDHLGCPAPTKK